MNVSQFREWLLTQDQEATVEIIVHSSGTGYYDQGGNVSVEEFEGVEWKHFEYTDLRGNPRIDETKEYYNKRYLQLGTKDN